MSMPDGTVVSGQWSRKARGHGKPLSDHCLPLRAGVEGPVSIDRVMVKLLTWRAGKIFIARKKKFPGISHRTEKAQNVTSCIN
jgi:hypothetical protein